MKKEIVTKEERKKLMALGNKYIQLEEQIEALIDPLCEILGVERKSFNLDVEDIRSQLNYSEKKATFFDYVVLRRKEWELEEAMFEVKTICDEMKIPNPASLDWDNIAL